MGKTQLPGLGNFDKTWRLYPTLGDANVCLG